MKPVHVILPITETHLPIYHSEQHYPVIVKTEDLPHIARPIVISEERPPLEPQTVADDNLPVQPEQQSYVEEAEEEASVQEEFSDRGVADQEQEQRVLHSQEEVTNTAVCQPDNIDEQTRDEQIQDEQIQGEQIQDEQIQGEEFQHEQIRDEQTRGVQIQDEQLREVSDAPLPDHEQFTSEGNFPAEDSSTPWMQESSSVDAQQPDEFYTPSEQVIPQSQAYSQEYQEDSYDDNEPWNRTIIFLLKTGSVNLSRWSWRWQVRDIYHRRQRKKLITSITMMSKGWTMTRLMNHNLQKYVE